MSIQTELARITNAKAAIKSAIEGKGVTVPDATLLDGMASLIESIEAGGSGGGTNYGTVTYETYSQMLSFGVPIPEDNFFVAILPTNTISSLGSNYLFHLNYRKINGKEFCISQSSSANSANELLPTFDRSANTMTLPKHYFKGSYEYMWYMGALQ